MSVVLVALIVPCDQDLLGRLSFDSVGRAVRPNSKVSIQMIDKGCKASLGVPRLRERTCTRKLFMANCLCGKHERKA